MHFPRNSHWKPSNQNGLPSNLSVMPCRNRTVLPNPLHPPQWKHGTERTKIGPPHYQGKLCPRLLRGYTGERPRRQLGDNCTENVWSAAAATPEQITSSCKTTAPTSSLANPNIPGATRRNNLLTHSNSENQLTPPCSSKHSFVPTFCN